VSDFPTQNGLTAEQRDELILDHLPLLHHIVGRMAVELPARLEREDLLGYGMLGLVGAADSWDPDRGLKFSTFAYPRIRGAILDELRRMDFLPRGRRERVRELEKTARELEQQGGEPAAPEELAVAMGITLDEVDDILAQARSAAEASLDEGDEGSLAGMLSDPTCDDPVGSAEREEMRELLAEVITSLPEQEQSVINLYYGEELLLKEIGEILGVTESRVSQIHSRALYRLNKQLASMTGHA
jgi:RNA polymerase sigma factor for flagellar operon FliA